MVGLNDRVLLFLLLLGDGMGYDQEEGNDKDGV